MPYTKVYMVVEGHLMVGGSTASPQRIYHCIHECTNSIYISVYGKIKGCSLYIMQIYIGYMRDMKIYTHKKVHIP